LDAGQAIKMLCSSLNCTPISSIMTARREFRLRGGRQQNALEGGGRP